MLLQIKSICTTLMVYVSHSPAGSDSWCKYDVDRTNNTQTCKPGSGLPKDIIYNINPKFGMKERHWHWKVFAW